MTAVKGVIADEGDAGRNLNVLQLAAALESPRHDGPKTLGKGDLFQRDTGFESAWANDPDTFRDGYGFGSPLVGEERVMVCVEIRGDVGGGHDGFAPVLYLPK